MKMRKVTAILLTAVLLLSAFTSCARKENDPISKAEDILASKAHAIEVDIDYHSVDTAVAGIFEQLERTETTLYFKNGSFKSVTDETINTGEGDYHFHSEDTVVDGVLYRHLTYPVGDGIDAESNSQALVDSSQTQTLIGKHLIIGSIADEDFSRATVDKRDGNTYLVLSDVSEQMYINLEKALVSQLQATSDSVKATAVKLTVELDGKRYDTVSVECNFNVTIDGKTYFVAMTVELEFEYDAHFDITPPANSYEYTTVKYEDMI